MFTPRLFGWILLPALLFCLGCAVSPESEPGNEREELGTAQAPIEDVVWIPEDEPSPLPLFLSWTTTIGAPVGNVTSLTVRVRNTRSQLRSYTLAVKSFGLDHRTVERSLGSFEVAGNQERTHTINLRDLPLKSVSHASELTVEATIVHEGEPLVLSTPSAFVHFASSGAASGTVYGYEAMQDSFQSGLIGTNAFSLAGAAFDGTNYVEIGDLRRREGLTGPEFGPVYLAQGNGPNSPLTPSPGGWFKVCAKWKSKFVDTGWDDYASNAGQQTTPAAWALAEIRQSPSLICPSPDPAGCTTLVWAGALKEDGCVTFNPTTSTNYIVKVYTQVVVPPSNPAALPQRTSTIKYFDSALTDRGVQALVRSFATPGTTSPSGAALTLPYHLTTNAAAAASRLFALSDLPNGKYDLLVNHGCPSQNGLTQYDSCADDGLLYLGPADPASNLEPDVSWKNVIGHELGHLVQRHLDSRAPANLSPCDGCGFDDPTDPAVCQCAHVNAANRTHCLQSSERAGTANVEGFGHFFAAKLWNDPAGSDCWFNYYKEIIKDDGSIGADLPVKVDCRNAKRWRDSRCFRAERGTEVDWLQFLWNLNTVGVDKISLSEIGAIHRKACGGSCAALDVDLTWSMLRQGALDTYGNTADPQFQHLEETGDVFGVDEDL